MNFADFIMKNRNIKFRFQGRKVIFYPIKF